MRTADSRWQACGQSSEADLLERAADPGALVLARLEPAPLHQFIRILVPGAVGKVMAEHRCRSLRFARNAERHVDLGQSVERLFDVPRGLILRHDHLEAIDRADEVVLLL